MLQPQDLLDVLNLLILHDLVMPRLAHVEDFTAQRKDAKVVAADHVQASDSERLGGISFRQNECAVLRVLRPGIVGVR